ncbi:MAG TPA: hypothetical protein VM659_13695 [Dongiaceae bacterium]|nr:hypothetical protein [Dongiaceae bacterium]
MSRGLLPCAHCEGAPQYIAGRLEAVIVCEECGISTPACPITTSREDTLTRLTAIWNTRAEPRPADIHKIAALARRELSSVDLPYFLNLLATTNSDWPTNGPMFAAMAARLVEPDSAVDRTVPPATCLADAGRYRKLAALAKIIQVDGRPWVRFPSVDALGAQISDEDKEAFGVLEEFIAKAVDALPSSGS